MVSWIKRGEENEKNKNKVKSNEENNFLILQFKLAKKSKF